MSRTLAFGCRWIDDGFHLGDGIGWKAALGGMIADHLLIGGIVDAVNLVAGDIAVDPLDLGAKGAEHSAGSLGDSLELIGGQLPRAGDLAFDNVLGHGTLRYWTSGRLSVPGEAAHLETLVEDEESGWQGVESAREYRTPTRSSH
jgi:hypothetical protein